MPPPGFLEKIVTETLTSPHTGAEYSISLACGEAEPECAPRALLIVLDAPYVLGTVVETVQLQEMGGEVSAPIVVGIGTSGSFEAHALQRLKDFTPPQSDAQRAEQGPVRGMLASLATKSRRSIDDLFGGAEAFLEFICTDLLPHVSSRFPVDRSDIGLLGHSAGAVFCHYALLRRPEIFRRYLIGSLGIGWYGEDLSGLEKDFSTGPKLEDRVSVFQAVGETELQHPIFGPSLRDGLDAMERLASSAPRAIDLTQTVISAETHCSVMAPLAAAGIRTLYGSGSSFLDAL